jgi:hypothetical protein
VGASCLVFVRMLSSDELVIYVPAAVFVLISTGQMAIWALKKHNAYKKEFGKAYPKDRKAMIPFLF